MGNFQKLKEFSLDWFKYTNPKLEMKTLSEKVIKSFLILLNGFDYFNKMYWKDLNFRDIDELDNSYEISSSTKFNNSNMQNSKSNSSPSNGAVIETKF